MAQANRQRGIKGGVAVRLMLGFTVAVYAGVMLYLLLFKYVSPLQVFSAGRVWQRSVEWVPFVGMYRYLFSGRVSRSLALMNVGGNILLFVPLGLLLQLWKRRPGWKAIGITALVSLGVEVLQWGLALGASDVDDVILNTLGGAIGVGLYWLLERLFRGKERPLRSFVAVAGTVAGLVTCGYFVILIFFTTSTSFTTVVEGEEYRLTSPELLVAAQIVGYEEGQLALLNMKGIVGREDVFEPDEFTVWVGQDTPVTLCRVTTDWEGGVITQRYEPAGRDILAGLGEADGIFLDLEETDEGYNATRVLVIVRLEE